MPDEAVEPTYKVCSYEELYPEDIVKGFADDGIAVPPKSDFTCNLCPDVASCEFAWDLYNTGNDCLASK